MGTESCAACAAAHGDPAGLAALLTDEGPTRYLAVFHAVPVEGQPITGCTLGPDGLGGTWGGVYVGARMPRTGGPLLYHYFRDGHMNRTRQSRFGFPVAQAVIPGIARSASGG